MGLDSYLLKIAKTKKMKMLYKLEGIEYNKEVAYWRKAYNINEFVLGNFYEGEEDGNCSDIELNKEQLDMLIEFISNGGGVDEEHYTESEIDGDLLILTKIRDEIDWKNEKLIYYAWW